jgi:hypothetical protein
MTEDELFATPALRVHEPPPGGLERVRAALDHRRSRWWLVAIPAIAAAVVVAIVLVGRGVGPNRAAQQATSQVAPLVADPTIAAGDRVSFYWVASQSQPASPVVRAVTPNAFAPPKDREDLLVGGIDTVDAVGRPPAPLIP